VSVFAVRVSVFISRLYDGPIGFKYDPLKEKYKITAYKLIILNTDLTKVWRW